MGEAKRAVPGALCPPVWSISAGISYLYTVQGQEKTQIVCLGLDENNQGKVLQIPFNPVKQRAPVSLPPALFASPPGALCPTPRVR